MADPTAGGTTSAATIDRIEAWHCRIPLAAPLQLGDITIARRDFVVVRVTTSDSVEGVAYALSRGGPVDVAVTDVLAPILIGASAGNITQRFDDMIHGTLALGSAGIVQRAISMIDICLWDIKAKAAGLPVWRLLGGFRESSPAMLVAPYLDAGESGEAYAARLSGSAVRGYGALKLYPEPDPLVMASRLESIRAELEPSLDLVVDMAWLWRSAGPAIQAVRAWAPFRLAWVEDPMPPSDWRSIRALSRAVDTPIGAGDDVAAPSITEALIERRAVGVLRLDATTVGGFTEFARIRSLAARAGLPVSPHAYPEIHRHCAYAWPDVGPIEMFVPGSQTWGASVLLDGEEDLAPGSTLLKAPETHGLGLRMNWDGVLGHAVRASEIRA